VSDGRVPRPRPSEPNRTPRLRSPNWRRRPTPPVLPSFDVVTRTEREARNDAINARQRRYLRVMIPCIALMLFGFFVPAPIPLRLVALAIASILPPIAAIVGNG
jgi:hypothetical protein